MIDAIENSAYAVWVRESPSISAYTWILSLHAMGLAIIVGINVMVALRLLGFVPEIPGSGTFDEAQVVDAIARADYDRPEGYERPEAPPPGQPLPHEGGVFRRFTGGFREDDD